MIYIAKETLIPGHLRCHEPRVVGRYVSPTFVIGISATSACVWVVIWEIQYSTYADETTFFKLVINGIEQFTPLSESAPPAAKESSFG